MKLGPVTPILRMFDIDSARGFYVSYLGFAVDWEHRFEPELPLYMQVSRDGCLLHLSQHHADATPGSAIRISIEGVEDLHRELSFKVYPFQRPSLEDMPWGTRELRLTDPFGNRLVFYDSRDE